MMQNICKKNQMKGKLETEVQVTDSLYSTVIELFTKKSI